MAKHSLRVYTDRDYSKRKREAMAWKERNHPRGGIKIEGRCAAFFKIRRARRQDADNAANSRYHSRYELFIPRENEAQPASHTTQRTCFIVATWRFSADHCYATPRGATGPSLLAIIASNCRPQKKTIRIPLPPPAPSFFPSRPPPPPPPPLPGSSKCRCASR